MKPLIALLILGSSMSASLLVPTYGMAAGSPDLHDGVVDSSSASASEVFVNELRWGCGTHRHYDPKARKCVGPGNF